MSPTRIEVSAAEGGRARVVVLTDGPSGRGHLGVRILALGVGWARLALVAEGALLLAGDVIGVEVIVGPDTRLDVVEPSGTVAYDMRGGSARWTVSAWVGPGSVLSWPGQPLVLAAGAQVSRAVQVDLAPGAVALLRETLVLGRSGEPGGTLHQSTAVTYAGQPLLVEDLCLEPGLGRSGILGGARVLDTVSVLGRRAPGIPDPLQGSHRLELDGPGTVVRALGAHAHQVSLATLWTAVAALPEAHVAATA